MQIIWEEKTYIIQGKKILQTSCSCLGAYKITNVVRMDTSHVEWVSGGESQSISVWASIRDARLSPLSLNMLYLWECGAVWCGEAGVQQMSHFFIPSPGALSPSCYLKQQGLRMISSPNS